MIYMIIRIHELSIFYIMLTAVFTEGFVQSSQDQSTRFWTFRASSNDSRQHLRTDPKKVCIVSGCFRWKLVRRLLCDDDMAWYGAIVSIMADHLSQRRQWNDAVLNSDMFPSHRHADEAEVTWGRSKIKMSSRLQLAWDCDGRLPCGWDFRAAFAQSSKSKIRFAKLESGETYRKSFKSVVIDVLFWLW